MKGKELTDMLRWMKAINKETADLAERVEALEKEANTHLYWTPSEIGAARHKARELMKHFDNIEKTDEPALLGSDNSLEAYVEGRMESDPLGSDNDLPPMRLKCGAHGIVECPECLEAFKDACRVDPEGMIGDYADKPELDPNAEGIKQGSWICDECGKDWGDGTPVYPEISTGMSDEKALHISCGGKVTWHKGK